ncbi:Nup358 [Strongyloides ratti]|uniref:Nup358 n=1 Tax=Strongyloides ratti TaxID=34506 RepID=A0A090LEH3_STRRB|nr:Nup358 [Strongyloides ratti]CEF68166.1 Nup358 [Strongyloides ratti]
MSNISCEKETTNIGDQISAYLKANTSALGELIKQIIYESNETRRQLTEVKNSLEQVHEGMKILGERVAALSLSDNSSSLEETKQQHNLEMDRLVKVFEIATSIKKEVPTNPQVSALTPQQLLQIQQQQQQMAAFQQQVLQQQNLARMMQMQQVQQYNPLSMLQGMVDSNNTKPVQQPPVHTVSQNQVTNQGNSLLKAQLTQPASTVVVTPTKKEEVSSVNSSQGQLSGGNSNTPSIFGKAQVQSKSFFSTMPVAPSSTVTENNEANKSAVENDDEAPEDFEPDVQFKPVVPLPDLVKVKTGEEDETVLFQEQCKLFRFDEDLKEFKERGIGKIKILRNETTKVTRVVMRREQVHKVCANFLLTKGMTIRLKPNSSKVCVFKCFDNSDDTPAHVTLCAKFGEESNCSRFISIFLESTKNDGVQASSGVKEFVPGTPKTDEINKLVPKMNSVKEEVTKKYEEQSCTNEEDEASDEDTADESYESSDVEYESNEPNQFKIPEKVAGSWDCSICYVNNLPTASKCVCCETARDGKGDDEKPKATLKGNVFTSPVSNQFSFGFGGLNTSGSNNKPLFGAKATDTEEKKSDGTNIFGQNKDSSKTFSIFGGNKESAVTTTSEQNKEPEKSNVSLFDQAKTIESPKQPLFSFAGATVKTSNEPSPFQFTPGKTTSSNVSFFGGAKPSTPSTEGKSLFGQTSFGGSLKDGSKVTEEKGASTESKPIIGQTSFGGSLKSTPVTSEEKGSSTEVKSVFGKSAFGGSLKDTPKKDERETKVNESKPLFGQQFSFGKKSDSNDDNKTKANTSEPLSFGKTTMKPIFGSSSFSSNTNTNISNKPEGASLEATTNKSGGVFGGGSQSVSFSTIAKSGTNFLSDNTKNEVDPFKVDPSKHKVFSSAQEKTVKSNDDDEEGAEDDYQPDIHFEPVVPLPDLVDVKTGEEDEEMLLSYKVRLYIMKSSDGSSEWKERGTGELRLLKSSDTNSYRIVMRRDQTQKLCANMRLYKHMKFTYNKMKERVLLFKATDCSDDLSNTIPETYCIRFSSSDDALKFSEVANNITENLL